MTAEENAALVAMWEAGVPTAEIADRMGYCTRTITLNARKLGLARRPGGRIRYGGLVSRELASELRELYAQGMSCAQIGARHNLHRSTVYGYVKGTERKVTS